ncbi:YIP1 family protein [Mahella australiensis]|uniref:YIP1 family protein n=1 Tax=Mahella australiensis TaxID=252966 RepID=UPI00031410EB|nr:YIP1 family protein [Mahella australiensis]
MDIIKTSLLVVFHPTDGFECIKAQRERFNYLPAIILLFMVIAERVAYIYLTHYPLATLLPRDANIWLEIMRMMLPILTWVVADYAVTTIMDGETLIRETLMATAYAMLPYIILIIPLALISHLMGQGELGLYNALQNIMWAWVFILFFISVQTLNEYNFWRTLGICILSIIAMLLIWAIAMLFFALSSQLYHFIEEVILEIRMLYLK